MGCPALPAHPGTAAARQPVGSSPAPRHRPPPALSGRTTWLGRRAARTGSTPSASSASSARFDRDLRKVTKDTL